MLITTENMTKCKCMPSYWTRENSVKYVWENTFFKKTKTSQTLTKKTEDDTNDVE